MTLTLPRIVLILALLGLVRAMVLIGRRYDRDMTLATARAAQGAALTPTRCGSIDPLLVVHDSGGGHDQGVAFAGTRARRGVGVIAMSRFGYLRTPMPADASAEAQADSAPPMPAWVEHTVASARADRYGTYGGAAYATSRIAGATFVGFDRGGHTWVGHDDKAMADVVRLLTGRDAQ